MAISSEMSSLSFTDLQSKKLPRGHREEDSQTVMEKEIPSPS